ncbi:resolvase-like serine recombinase [Citrifermentans bemidjiense Bem]|uniref:Resolvase-like serine recombinase n=1 Tax=Citrifermentans bemidjiense (strain ATCC BAA-1014 / DSM 16622 / JCM 12645 / Bem) TaxID=404380 RepID=B5EDN9_CITBB|nr:recombinase family protein [Citrifermentans bemidjiense]ACH40667.1 resolvase-like serine recombinase [Citrifermentans bemidjiense Bem]
MARAFSYLRFSRPEQRKGDSLRRQTEAAREYADRHNLALDDFSFRDLGHSAYRGSHAEIGGLSQFLAAIDTGHVKPGDYLLIENFDRLSRQVLDEAFDLLRTICNKGISVVTLQDGNIYDKESLSRNFASLMWALFAFARAHDESAVKSDRLLSTWHNKRKDMRVKPLTGKLPGWLRLSAEKQITVIEDRAEVVKEIFTRYVEGQSPRTIVNRLNQNNVECWGIGKQKSKKWNSSYIQKILDNESVIGRFTPHKIMFEGIKKTRVPLETVNDYFPVIIDAETFNRVQEVRTRNKLGRRKATGGLTNAFSMLFRCPVCGSWLVRVNKNSKSNWQYLVCGAAKAGYRDADSGYRLCPGGYKAVRYDVVEQAFVDAVLCGRFISSTGSALEAVEAAIEAQRKRREESLRRSTNLTNAIAEGALKGSSPVIKDLEKYSLEVVGPADDDLQIVGKVEHWTVAEELELLASAIKGAEIAIERLELDREALKPRTVDIKLRELKMAVCGPEIDRQKINMLLQALCDSSELNADTKEMTFNLRHADKPVVVVW